MKKLHPVYDLSDEPIGVQMPKAEEEKTLRRIRRELRKYIREHPGVVSPSHILAHSRKSK